MSSTWVSINDYLPPLETKCIVARPNEFSKKVDVLIAYLHDSGEVGRSWGTLYNRKWLNGYYWSLPAVCPLDHITHWMLLPEPPSLP